MKVFSYFISILCLIFFFGQVGYAQADIITADQFSKDLKAGDQMVIIDANKAKTYQINHVKGAIFINHNDLYQEGDIKGLIKSPAEMADFFGKNGLSANSKIVIYDDGTHKYTSRLYWILKYLGAEDVKLLHKDMEVWKQYRIPLETAAVTLPPATFTPKVNPSLLATLDEVEVALSNPNAVVVDARAKDEYMGQVPESKGHIPGAINVDFKEFETATGDFKSVEELKALATSLGLTPDKELVFYCQTSVRACVPFFVFNHILGYPNVKVYDGAYNEWVVKKGVEAN
jgi:thiosulfate/3-mercaptopyruvate sulfurtransferase